MTSNDFVTANHIIASVASTVNDTKFRTGFSTGWYMTQIQDALQELAFDTYYDEVTLDFDMPENLRMEIPKNVFNVKQVYVWNGNGGCCSPANSQIVHWKRQFDNKGDGDGYTARVHDGAQHNQSPFVSNHFEWGTGGITTTKYYANIQNGTLMLSSTCRAFAKVRIICSGMGVAVGDVPLIPRFFEQAIKDWVKEKFYDAMKARDVRKYRPLWVDAKQERTDLRTGSWREARLRVSGMDSWEKEDMNEYISAIYHK